jgi:Arc/MetJ family transcription regulator
MRTNIEIDDKLMSDAIEATGLTTKREVVDTALRELVRLRRQAAVKKLKGKFRWEGDLDAMRRDK